MDIIFDIDGTVLDISHRLRFIKQKPKDWKSFRDPKQKRWDEPRIEIINIASALQRNSSTRLIFASGRSESERLDTIRSLSRWFLLDGWQKIKGEDLGEIASSWNFPTLPFYMRQENDYRKDTVVKAEMLDQMRRDGYDPVMAFDDRPSVVRMWREQGLVVADVGEGKEF